jgi:hypothetical protein
LCRIRVYRESALFPRAGVCYGPAHSLREMQLGRPARWTLFICPPAITRIFVAGAKRQANEIDVPVGAPARPTLLRHGAPKRSSNHAQGSAPDRRIMRRRLVSHRSRSMRRRLRHFGMCPDLRRSADDEPADLFLVPAQRPNEFLSAFASKRTPTVYTAACKSISALVVEYGLGAATGRSAPHHPREGTGRTRSFSCYACSGCYSPDHAHSRTVGSEKFRFIHEQ